MGTTGQGNLCLFIYFLPLDIYFQCKLLWTNWAIFLNKQYRMTLYCTLIIFFPMVYLFSSFCFSCLNMLVNIFQTRDPKPRGAACYHAAACSEPIHTSGSRASSSMQLHLHEWQVHASMLTHCLHGTIPSSTTTAASRTTTTGPQSQKGWRLLVQTI